MTVGKLGHLAVEHLLGQAARQAGSIVTGALEPCMTKSNIKSGHI